MDEPLKPWGIQVERVEIKDAILPQAMKRTITRLEEQLKKGSETKATYTKLSRKISELEVDELRMLRIEC